MKRSDQIMHIDTLKVLFMLALVLGALGLEVMGVYELYKEHLYYIIILFLFAELLLGIFASMTMGTSVFNLRNLIVSAAIIVTSYLCYREKIKKMMISSPSYTEGFDVDEEDTGSE